MNYKFLSLLSLLLALTACKEDSSGTSPLANSGKTGAIEQWQSSLTGQEGHGGDAIVCFSIPIEQALEKVSSGSENPCNVGESCLGHSGNTSPGNPSSPDAVWKMTDVGRKAISSAKPLEQYLAERIQSKKALLDQLNQMPIEDGYRMILSPFNKLPAAASRLSEVHQKLGWLDEDGISSEYGLRDVNDSGFIDESDIDTAHCKELQAVVRRDNQLWYDKDILHHFDNAGKILMQLHEEIYNWGKDLDTINWRLAVIPQHETSAKTRRLILKILDDNLATQIVNENLKSLGFSVMYNETFFNTPTPAGYYMDSDSCIGEQKYVRDYVKNAGYKDFWFKMERLFSTRYLATAREPMLELRYNFPNALSEMMAYTLTNSSDPNFASQLELLLQKFERPESCQGIL